MVIALDARLSDFTSQKELVPQGSKVAICGTPCLMAFHVENLPSGCDIVFEDAVVTETDALLDFPIKSARFPSLREVGRNSLAYSHLVSLTLDQVTTIGPCGLFSLRALTKLSMANVQSICKRGCANLVSLQLVSIPKLATCGPGAFEGCGLLSFYAPSLIAAGSNFLSKCPNLVLVHLPLLKTFPSHGAYMCSQLRRATLESVTTVHNDAFNRCVSMTSVTCPNLLMVYACAFMCSKSLTLVTGLPSVKYIGPRAFKETGLQVADCQNLQVAEDSAFAFCPNLAKVTVGDNFLRVPSFFCYRSNVAEFVTRFAEMIGANAFAGCPMQRFYTPDTMVYMDGTSFTSFEPSINTRVIYDGHHNVRTELPDKYPTIGKVKKARLFPVQRSYFFLVQVCLRRHNLNNDCISYILSFVSYVEMLSK